MIKMKTILVAAPLEKTSPKIAVMSLFLVPMNVVLRETNFTQSVHFMSEKWRQTKSPHLTTKSPADLKILML